MNATQFNVQLLRQISQTLGAEAQMSMPLQILLEQVSDTYDRLEQDFKWAEAEVELKTQQVLGTASNAYAFFDSLKMGFVMCDVTPEVVVVNQTVQQILNEGSSAKAGSWNLQSIDKLFNFDLTELVKQSMDQQQSIERDDISFGKVILRLYIAPILNKTEKKGVQPIGTAMILEDVTEQKLLERSRDEFFSIASHELRTPLTAIRGNSAMLSDYYGKNLPDQDSREMVADIHSSAIRLIKIVNDFLDVSRLETGKIEMQLTNFPLAEVVDEVVREAKKLCDEKSLTLTSDIDATIKVKADRARIKQVIYNLLGNAIKFTEKGGISISAKIDGEMVEVNVVDTGLGMNDDAQRLLFRKFQQAGSSLLTRDTTRGTGLGLYISKLIVEQSDGKIWVKQSEVGKGSTFALTLPLAI